MLDLNDYLFHLNGVHGHHRLLECLKGGVICAVHITYVVSGLV